MSCCGNHNHENHQNSKDGQHGGSHNTHKWMMILCVLPVILAAVFFLTKGTGGTVSNYFPLFLILLCPLSHFILMPLMHKKKDHHSKS